MRMSLCVHAASVYLLPISTGTARGQGGGEGKMFMQALTKQSGDQNVHAVIYKAVE
jgi:hypothetical protein